MREIELHGKHSKEYPVDETEAATAYMKAVADIYSEDLSKKYGTMFFGEHNAV